MATPENNFVPADQALKVFDKEKKKRQDDYNEKNRLVEGEHKGKLMKISEETSRPPNSNPMWVLDLRCKGNLGKNVTEKIRICKHLDFHMAVLYKIIKLAGFSLKKITSTAALEEVVDRLQEECPSITFTCKHQTNSTHNDYTITEIDNVGGESVEEPVEGPEKSGSSDYTEEEILEYSKEDCLEVAEELELELKSKVKSKMQQELIEHLFGEKAEEPAEEPGAEPEETVVYTIEDIQSADKAKCIEIAEGKGIELSSKILSKMKKELIEELGLEVEEEPVEKPDKKAVTKKKAVAEEVVEEPVEPESETTGEEDDGDPFPDGDE